MGLLAGRRPSEPGRGRRGSEAAAGGTGQAPRTKSGSGRGCAPVSVSWASGPPGGRFNLRTQPGRGERGGGGGGRGLREAELSAPFLGPGGGAEGPSVGGAPPPGSGWPGRPPAPVGPAPESRDLAARPRATSRRQEGVTFEHRYQTVLESSREIQHCPVRCPQRPRAPRPEDADGRVVPPPGSRPRGGRPACSPPPLSQSREMGPGPPAHSRPLWAQPQSRAG